MMTLTRKNGNFLWYKNIFLTDTQIAFMDTLKGLTIKDKTFYRNLFSNSEPMVVDLKKIELSINLEFDGGEYYFPVEVSIKREEEKSLFEAARCQFISDKGLDSDFIKPKIKEAIKTSLKKGTNDFSVETNVQLLKDVNNLIQLSEDMKFLDITKIDVFKKPW